MSSHLQRAQMLLEQGRYEPAEKELRRVLAEEPENPIALAFLGICLAGRKAWAEATQAAESAIGVAPDFDYAHYVHAAILADRHRYDEAERAVSEAIRLDPRNAEAFALLADLHLKRERWSDALVAADNGLGVDPENVRCANLRALALMKLGRREEAAQSIAGALEKEPDSALTHATRGWTLLENGEPAPALEHFREALRLNPDMEWARRGTVEALKSRYLVYRWILGYFFWMARLTPSTRWGIIIGGYVAYRFALGLQETHPALSPLIVPLLIGYIGFAYLTWTADAIFNLFLRFNRFGRLTLSPEERSASNCIGGVLLCAVILLTVYFARGEELALVGGLMFLFLTMVLAGTFRCHKGGPFETMTGVVVLLVALGAASLYLVISGRIELGDRLMRYYFWGVLLSSFLANHLATRRPQR